MKKWTIEQFKNKEVSLQELLEAGYNGFVALELARGYQLPETREDMHELKEDNREFYIDC